MTDLPGNLYRYFKDRRGIFFTLVFMLCLVLGWMAMHIRFEEDIAQSNTSGNNLKDAAAVMSKLKLTDKLIILISLRDSLAPPDPAALAACGARLADSLAARFDTTLVASVTFRSSDSVMLLMNRLVLEHQPVFLEESDYAGIDSLCRPGSIAASMEKNYRILVSPAGMVLKQRIRQDPLGITGQAFGKLRSLDAGGNFEIFDGCVYSPGLRHLLLFVLPAKPAAETDYNDRLISGLDETIGHLNAADSGKFSIRYFGGAAVAVSNARQVKKDITMTMILALTAIFLLIGWYYRDFRIPLLGMLPALFGGTLALSLIGLLKGKLSVISLGIGSVILGLIIDYTLYIINHVRNTRDMNVTLKEMSLTILLCSLTTTGAFLCLTFLRSVVLQDLGWFAALSVAGAAFFTLLILPHLLPVSIKAVSGPVRITFIDRLAAYPFERKRGLIGVLLMVTILSLWFAGKTSFEKDMWALSYVTPELGRTGRELDRIADLNLKTMYLVYPGNDNEEALRRRERMAARIDSLIRRGIVRYRSDAGPLLLSDSLQELRIRQWNRYWTPERKREVVARLSGAAKERGFRADAFNGFHELLDRKYDPLHPSDIPEPLHPLIRDWLTRDRDLSLATTILKVAASDRGSVFRELGDTPEILLFDRQSITEQFIERVRKDFDLLVLLSMGFVTLLLILSFGRVGLGIMTAAPMFLSWLLTLGFMGVTGIHFNIFNIIISSFIFGLGVDYSILVMRGLQQALRNGETDQRAYKVSVLLSALTTLFGVGALGVTRHPALNSIALISVFGITSVVLLSFTLQPFLYQTLLLRRQQSNRFPVTVRIFFKTIVTWGNIVMIALILMFLGSLINWLLPVSRKKKELLFHRLFSSLCRAYIAFTFNRDRKLINEPGEDFLRPAIIISNHQSLIETPAFLSLYPKMIILTNSWVYRSPVFGPIARLANFYNIDDGLENLAHTLKARMEEGFSVLIFPEAHRSKDQHIQRFHRGAFYLAEQLHADILPMLVFGSGDFLGRGAFWGRPNGLRMKIFERVRPDDLSFGNNYRERARNFRQFYIREYARLRAEEGTAGYYRRTLALNYVMKGPVLEWYMRVKMRLERNYDRVCREMPARGAILDLGCGYGFASYMLMFTGEGRRITGVDHDKDKIAVAQNGFARNDRLCFIQADITHYPITPHAGFLLGDVLHYLTPGDQESLLRRCMENLEPGGCILIREANASLRQRQRWSALTELFSTRSGFNKTANPEKRLYFTSAEKLANLAASAGLSFRVVDNKKVTSNNLYILRK